MDKLNIEDHKLLELDSTEDGIIMKEIISKLNEIIDWINTQ
tara:strand:- start:1662 stop:1784 length:123 start_codon:yes stop_codon:yes gene_type:complete